MYKILIADDNKQITNILSSYAKNDGYTPLVAYDGKEALEIFRKGGVDLCLLDVMMPGMNGFDVKRRIENDTPVIFVTAKQSLTDQLTGLSLGADDYITKPFDMLVLLARIENILRRTMKNTTIYRINNCVIDTESRNVKVKNRNLISSVLTAVRNCRKNRR